MISFFHKFVTNRLSRLRVCLLFLLGMASLCLILGLNGSQGPMPVSGSSAGLGPDALSGMVVVLDPGHGGYDGGARAVDSGKWEKEIILQIAKHVEQSLVDHGAKVVLTRREDVDFCGDRSALLHRKRQDLQTRVDMALEAKAHVFLSLHLNEYRSRKESGPQVFYQRGGDDGRLLAGVLQAALIQELDPPRKRVALAGNYYVLRSSIPSALVECGFLSNAAEEKLLLSDAYQQRIGQAITQGLADYARLLDLQGRSVQQATGVPLEEGP